MKAEVGQTIKEVFEKDGVFDMQDKETLMTLDTQGDNAFLGGDAIDHIKHILLFQTEEGAELLNVFG